MNPFHISGCRLRTTAITFLNYFSIIQRALGSGIVQLKHQTGFDATRLITRDLPPHNINPFWSPGNQVRANLSGNYRLFTTDRKEDAYLEEFGHSGDGKIPLNTYELLFRFDGRTLNFERVADSDFRSLFYKTGNTQDENHAFSLCVDYYLECNKFISGYETYGWLSRSGDAAGVTG
jgi:hypothetical protein